MDSPTHTHGGGEDLTFTSISWVVAPTHYFQSGQHVVIDEYRAMMIN